MNCTRRFARLERHYPTLPLALALAQWLEVVAEGGLVLVALRAISHGVAHFSEWMIAGAVAADWQEISLLLFNLIRLTSSPVYKTGAWSAWASVIGASFYARVSWPLHTWWESFCRWCVERGKLFWGRRALPQLFWWSRRTLAEW